MEFEELMASLTEDEKVSQILHYQKKLKEFEKKLKRTKYLRTAQFLKGHYLEQIEILKNKLSKLEVRTTPKTGRNEPCSCGCGLKYKKCKNR